MEEQEDLEYQTICYRLDLLERSLKALWNDITPEQKSELKERMLMDIWKLI